MLKLGIIGAGRLGSFHADKAAAHKTVQLVGVLDPSEPARKNLAEKYHIQEYFTIEELIPNADAVVIASPTLLHYKLGEICLQNGLHVLMEKPMCDSWNNAQKLVETAQQTGVVFQIGHVEEFNPAWLVVQAELQEIKNGAPAIIDAVRTSGYTFRSTDIGTVFDMMIHDLDLVLSLIPSPVLWIDAAGFNTLNRQLNDIALEDIANAQVRFENGTIARFYSSRVAPDTTRKMCITSMSSSITIDFAARTVKKFQPDQLVLQGLFNPKLLAPDTTTKLAPNFMKEHFTTTEMTSDTVPALTAVDALAKEMDDFVESIQTSRQPRVSGHRALAAVAVAETIVESIRKKRPIPFNTQKLKEPACENKPLVKT
ncbi:MAG: Gfo/Idh/MocA family oxidoreductase [Planctomycetaceae bacterium]|jgi:predicted dehydrogenase|nr:Gfo/Idh/MocA family oxidoreductase [Planctomycetaceae bacterium]